MARVPMSEVVYCRSEVRQIHRRTSELIPKFHIRSDCPISNGRAPSSPEAVRDNEENGAGQLADVGMPQKRGRGADRRRS